MGGQSFDFTPRLRPALSLLHTILIVTRVIIFRVLLKAYFGNLGYEMMQCYRPLSALQCCIHAISHLLKKKENLNWNRLFMTGAVMSYFISPQLKKTRMCGVIFRVNG
jgi:Na+-transporting NADH:ubiquinone oxidoreductase subunit NqrE